MSVVQVLGSGARTVASNREAEVDRFGSRTGAPFVVVASGWGIHTGEETAKTQRQIVVPRDGSRLAEQALTHAITLARATGSGIKLLQEVSIQQPANTIAWGVPAALTVQPNREEMVDSSHDYLLDTTLRLASESKAVQVEVLEGDAA